MSVDFVGTTSSTTTVVVNASDTTPTPTLPCELNDGDTAFVVVGAVMILGMMTNLAFFTAGLLRSNNTLSILMAHISSMVACSVLWLLFGYSLAFGTDHGESFLLNLPPLFHAFSSLRSARVRRKN
jgi:ammonia channel protein AmtB